MRFPWQRRKPKPEGDEVEQSKRALEEAEKDWSKVHEVVERAKELSERNGFADAISKAFGGKHA